VAGDRPAVAQQQRLLADRPCQAGRVERGVEGERALGEHDPEAGHGTRRTLIIVSARVVAL
jgi:hypothetical protein